ncbi:MAG: hypothetical protein C4547_10730 [Phycisphaerales bacterium]|nr:MAG: hypothetical protein C4547_10730 [Phycisphaerales bacterium]
MDRTEDTPVEPADDGRTGPPARCDAAAPAAPAPVPPPDDDAPFGVGLIDEAAASPPPEAPAEPWPDAPEGPPLEDADVDAVAASGDEAPDAYAFEAPVACAFEAPPISGGEAGAADLTGQESVPSAPAAAPADGITEREPGPAARPIRDSWDPAATPRHLAVELKRIEARITELLEGIDPRRKRRLEGTRRWLELQDDIAAMRFDGRIDEARVREINALCAKRHRLFRHLNFLVATRPTWNT